MKRIIITGASGFVGTNLMNYFHEINLGEVQRLDLRKTLPNILLTSDALIHLAGKAHDLKKTSVPSEYFEVNLNKTKALFDLFLESDIKDFIYFSSVKAVVDSIDGVLFEDTIPNPATPYGQSKFQAEKYILSKKLPEGRRVFIIRPCMIHGPGNKGNLNLLYQIVRKGIPYPLASFHNERSFLSITNLNYIIGRLILDTTISGGIYNVADDEPLSTNKVIKIISEVSSRKPKLWNINKKLIKVLAYFGDKLSLPLNSERLKKLTESYIVSNKKIKNTLRIKTLPVSSTQGLKLTIESFQSK